MQGVRRPSASRRSMKASFHTLGCKLNSTETSALAARFRERGFAVVDAAERSDVFVLNTCTVTGRADRECRQIVRRILRNSPDTFVIVTGCYAQLHPEEIAAIGGVDLVVGSAGKLSAADLAGDFRKRELPQIFVSCIDEETECAGAFSDPEGARTRAFLKVQDGCDFPCAFCTIPLARGASRSLPPDEVLAAAHRLAAEGYREAVLTGVNVGDYGRKSGTTLLELLRRLDAEAPLERIRVSSIEPNLLSEELVAFILGSRSIVNHFHLPLQSGSPRILAAMRRRYTAGRYSDLVGGIRALDPDAGIGADVIVGFPGETAEEFGETMRLLEELPLSYLHVFTYSERGDTPAAGMAGRVEPRVRFHRSERLRELGSIKRAGFHRRFVGRSLDVLFESASEGVVSGHTTNYIRVSVPGDASLVNSIAPAEIGTASADGCGGALAPLPEELSI